MLLEKTDFKVGQLVRSKLTKDIGRALDVEPDYYGARQAFKVYGAERGQALRPSSVNGIGPTKDGIRDKVLVRWYTSYVGLEHSRAEWMDGKDLLLMEEEDEE
tara:strand:+ start:66 stop:374 length:309 start_codon:yes stop_codon:yes gene_type:complete